jgi:hypothetical protein
MITPRRISLRYNVAEFSEEERIRIFEDICDNFNHLEITGYRFEAMIACVFNDLPDCKINLDVERQKVWIKEMVKLSSSHP